MGIVAKGNSMTKILRIAGAFLIALVLLALADQDFFYVGSSKCRACHRTGSQGRQYPIWEGSAHAKAFAGLTGPKAAAVAKSRNVADPATDARCLDCHSPLAAAASGLKNEGVTCEACHGPGSTYRKLSVMKNREEAVKSGLTSFPNAAAIQARCLKCHQNTHDKPFDFPAAWDKIKHAIPGKN